MTRLRAILFVLVAGTAVPAGDALAQSVAAPATPAAAVDAEAADRAAVLAVLSREDVRRAARIADLDLDATAVAVGSLEGERLSRAADQARSLDARLGAQADEINISTTALIIVLLLVAIIIVVA